jgi:hypothetical protein
MIIGMREITDRGRIGCVVTRYKVQKIHEARADYELVQTTTAEDTSYRVENDYLYLGNSEASARLQVLEGLALNEMDWSAQAGTPPVKVDGYWGGRNYPKIVVPASELRRVLGVEVSS